MHYTSCKFIYGKDLYKKVFDILKDFEQKLLKTHLP